MKVLQPYKDWLLLNRGEIRPEVGDKIKILSSTGELSYNEITGQISSHSKPLFQDDIITDMCIKHYNLWINNWFVEIDYNPNEAIEFAKWILHKETEKGNFNITSYIDRTDERKEIPVWGNNRLGYGKHYTSKELYQQFKQEQNGK